MSERIGVRDFDNPTSYEHEKVTRVMPADVKLLGMYVLRMMNPPGSRPYAHDLLICVVDKEEVHDRTFFGLLFATDYFSGHEGVREVAFNSNGFMFIDNSGREMPDQPDEIEMAYFVGSVDPIDVEFGHLVEEMRPRIELVYQSSSI
jgi:hypothetical protein